MHLLTRFGAKKLRVGATAAFAALALTACSSAPSADDAANDAPDNGAAALTVTDVTGREVSFDKVPERILLAEGRGMFAAAILNKDNPTEHIVALGSDLHKGAPSFEEKLLAVDPHLKDIPTVGAIHKGDVTVENLVAQNPDVVVMTLDHKKAAEESGFLDKMDKAGLTYVFTDFRHQPMENTTTSMTLLGDLLGKEDKAEEFNEFWTNRVEKVKKAAAAQSNHPKTFVWRAAGLKDCCATTANANLGQLVNVAGGDNMGDHLIEGVFGDLTPEKVLAEQPEVIITTGGSWAKDPAKPETFAHVEMGYNATKEVAEKTLAGVLSVPGFDQLEAPKKGDLHAVWHQFYDSPYNVFALEQFAKWVNPEAFQDLDPEKDFADFHKEWMPFELDGVFFATAPATA